MVFAKAIVNRAGHAGVAVGHAREVVNTAVFFPDLVGFWTDPPVFLGFAGGAVGLAGCFQEFAIDKMRGLARTALAWPSLKDAA